MTTIDTKDGAKVYTPFALKLYDFWVLSVSNSYAWRCPTQPILLKHFQHNLLSNHLDIGVGTGYYLANSDLQGKRITLMDLNANSLAAANNRIAKVAQTLEHDIYKPLDASLHHQFDSVSLFYLLHCLPGNMQDKKAVIEHAAQALKAEGVLSGATILGKGVEHNGFGKKLMAVYNKKGIFGNVDDSLDALRDVLNQFFNTVQIDVHGVVAVFSARDKK